MLGSASSLHRLGVDEYQHFKWTDCLSDFHKVVHCVMVCYLYLGHFEIDLKTNFLGGLLTFDHKLFLLGSRYSNQSRHVCNTHTRTRVFGFI